MPKAHRLVLIAVGLAAVPVILALGEHYGSLRLFEVLDGEAGNLIGRQLLWPMFKEVAAQAPWFGWGLGSGNLVIPRDGMIAILLGTQAAHNEHLRIQVEGGHVGRTPAAGVVRAVGKPSHTRRLAAVGAGGDPFDFRSPSPPMR